MKLDSVIQDQQQRQLALDATQSFIVQAPAGSGKTELLIQRTLTLLKHVKKPEEVLAITFTKKAANEMRLRVIKALKAAQTEPMPDSPHAKQTWMLAKDVLTRDKQLHWNIINNPNQLRIQTIDALCTFITKQLPLLSHFGSPPDICENPLPLYRETVQEVLLHIEKNYEWSQSLANLLMHLDNDLNKLYDLLVTMLSKRDQWLDYLHFDNNSNNIRKLLESQLSLVISEQLKHAQASFPISIMDELFACARFAATHVEPSSLIKRCADIQTLPSTSANAKPLWQALNKLLLTDDGQWRKSFTVNHGFPAASSSNNAQEKEMYVSYKNRMKELMQILIEYDDFRRNLSAVSTLPNAWYDDNQWHILQDLLSILKILIAQLRITFQQNGQIDFIENARAALLAMGNSDHPTDLALALDYHIRHILIDEFQDTSFTQYQLIEKLIAGWEQHDGRTLFIVGDPMQSIYRFRQAEVGLFIRMREHGIAQIKLTPLTLTHNFRSTQKIVEWNNQTFERIFPLYDNISSGAVSYSPSLWHDSSNEMISAIRVHGLANTNEITQANQIIQLIKEMLIQYPQESIAILVRSRSHLAAIMMLLKQSQIPYKAIDIDPLATKQIIQDLLSLTCALIHPADKISWLAVLRAPWCGLSLADLLKISGENAYATIVEQLEQKNIISQLSTDGQTRLLKTYPILKTKILERDRSNLRDWVESTWLLLGGPACINNDKEMNDVKAFFNLLDEYNNQHQSINLIKLKEKIAQLYSQVQHENALLQIMTIHSAKGLEFDTVILPCLERKAMADDKSLLSWMEQPLANDKMALLLAPIHATGTDKDTLYEYIQRQQRIKADYETDRLLYVATTRAKKRLHLFFNVEINDNEPRLESGSFLSKLWDTLEKQFLTSDPVQTLAIDNAKNPRVIRRLSNDWKNIAYENKVISHALHQQHSGFAIHDHTAKHIGIITHGILQKLSQHGCAWWQDKPLATRNQYIHAHLMQVGIANSNTEHYAQIITGIIEKTLMDKRGQWILQAHTLAKSEFAVSTVVDNKVANYIIDRTFIDENGVRWIIDYKTSTLSDEDLTLFLAREQEKYLEQMKKYAQALHTLDEDRPIHLGLYFPAIPAWKEWQYM